MTLGTVISVNADGSGSPAPDSNGEHIWFAGDAVVGTVRVGDRVQFRARLTAKGVVAYALQVDPRSN